MTSDSEDEQTKQVKVEENNMGKESENSKVTVFQATQMPDFDSNSCKWNEWLERLEIHFVEIGATEDNIKVSTLLKMIGSEPYTLLRALCDPVLPAKKSYKELCDLLNTHYLPPVIVFRERVTFYAARKEPSESVTAWYARVKSLALLCKFSNLDQHICDKFVVGLATDEKIFDKLCEEDETLTLANAFKKALIQETKAKSKQSNEVNFIRARNQRGQRRSNGTNNGSKSRSNRGDGASSQKNACKHCGWRSHESSSCKYKDVNCNSCGKKGHMASVCFSKDKGTTNFISFDNHSSNSSQKNCNCVNNANNFSNFSNLAAHSGSAANRLDENYGIFMISDGRASDLHCLAVDINGIRFEVKCDTGSPCSLMPLTIFERYFDRKLLKRSHNGYNDYGGHSIDIIGEFLASITYRDQTKTVSLVITNVDRPILLGDDFLKAFNFKLMQVNSIVASEKTCVVERIKTEFSDVFKSELGTYSVNKVHLELKEGTAPIFFKPRPVPLAWKPKIENKLNQLVELGMLQPIDDSEWGTPIVPILKPTGDLRVCGDYKVTLNKFLLDVKYPLPRIEEIFAALQGGQLFTKLDLSNAYNQLELDEKSQSLCTWSTHKGLYKTLRLPFGVKVAGAIFQKTIENFLRGIQNCMNFVDDIVVTGPDFLSHVNTLNLVLDKLQSVGLRLNIVKCEFFKEQISYLGHNINSEGLKKNDSNVQSVLNAPEPKDVSEVRAFLGMVNYYSKFIPEFAKKMEPLYRLLRKDVKFHMSNECQMAYKLLKEEIASERVLVHFDPSKPIVLTTDACDTAVAGICSHEFPDKSLKPIAFVSRSLTQAERNYSTIHKEALAIIFSVTKLYQYLIGHKFVLQTDHKPLISIFGENKGIPLMAAARIQRWSFLLSGFDYTIRHIKGEHNYADALSRMPQPADSDLGLQSADFTYINFVDFENALHLNFKTIAIETRRDSILSKLLDAIHNGTVQRLNEANFIPFHSKSDELSIESGCILWGYRTVVPTKLRNQILIELHKSHLGIVKTKSLARSYIWWPKIDHDIETLIRNCQACQVTQASPEKSALIPWQPATQAWSRIHIDYAGPIHKFYLLVVVDSFSKWTEVFKTKEMTSEFTICKLRETFCRFGLVDYIVSDNGRQFTSDDFAQFTKANNISHIFTAPGHPATNGQAENFVKTLKKAIQANLKDVKPDKFDIILNRFLIDYRTTRHCTTGDSPAKLMFGREIKTRFSALKPPVTEDKIIQSQEIAIKNAKGKRNCQFEIGRKVFVRDYTNPNKASWIPATIEKKFGPRNYGCVLTHNGREIKRHLDQIRDTDNSANTAEASESTVSNESVNAEQLDTSGDHDTSQPSETVDVSDESSEDDAEIDARNEDDQFSTPGNSRPTRDCAANALKNIKEQRRLNLI